MQTNQLDMANDLISFQARFGGVAQALSIPVANVVAIYARENGQGMAFEAEIPDGSEAGSENSGETGDVAGPVVVPRARGHCARQGQARSDDKPPGGRGSHLKIIK